MATMDWGLATIDLPVPDSIDFLALGIAVMATVSLFRFNVGIIRTLCLCSLAGLVLKAGFGL
jgi:chromate transporter